jgi:hypothetical protein
MSNRPISELNITNVPFGISESEKQIIDKLPYTDKLNWIKGASPKLNIFLESNKNISALPIVKDKRNDANAKLTILNTTDKNSNNLVIGGKRTKRAKTSNRKTKNKRKKLHKRN